MAHAITRRHVNLALAAGGLTIISRRTRAAEINLKHSHNLPEDSPLHKRATELWAAVRAETGGKVDVQIMHGDAGLDGLRGGEIAFMTLAGNGIASLVPAADVQATPYGFRNPAEVHRAIDGELGAYLRTELMAKDIYALPSGCFENGMHQVTSTSKPVKSASDLQGVKMRVPGSPAYQDFFKSMGAQIVTVALTKVYDALKAGQVDAQDDPWDVVELFKFYEVQKFACVTDHSWSGYNMLASAKLWKGLPADVQRIVEANTKKYVALQRADNDKLNAELRRDLERRGMKFTDADKASFRAVLPSFYPRWKQHIGTKAWDLLEASVGKLG